MFKEEVVLELVILLLLMGVQILATAFLNLRSGCLILLIYILDMQLVRRYHRGIGMNIQQQYEDELYQMIVDSYNDVVGSVSNLRISKS